MSFNLNVNKGKWFELEGGERIQLRPITPGEQRRITKATTKKWVDYKKVEGVASRFDVTETNPELSETKEPLTIIWSKTNHCD